MESTITALTAEQLTAVAISAIVAKAALLVRQGEKVWDAYEWAKDAIADFTETPDEYQRAIKLLTDALGI